MCVQRFGLDIVLDRLHFACMRLGPQVRAVMILDVVPNSGSGNANLE